MSGQDITSEIERLRRLLKSLARFRTARVGGGLLERTVHRARRKAFLARLAAEWPGGAVEHETGDLVFVPHPLDARGRASLLQPPAAHPAALRFLRPGDVAVDIGANLGEWTLPLARAVGAAGRVIAFEPMPRIAEALATTMRLNNLPQVQIVRAAVSDRGGRAKFAVPIVNSTPADTGLADTGRAHLGAAASGEEGIEVATVTLDAALAAAGVSRVHLLKIDVEGHERAVLAAARKTLAEDRPAIVIETGHEAADDRAAIAEPLTGLGYELAGILLDHGVASASWEAYRNGGSPFGAGEVHNLLLLPRERQAVP